MKRLLLGEFVDIDARIASRRRPVAARRHARHRRVPRTSFFRWRGARATAAGAALCGHPCGADVPLQALDRRRLARARGRTCGARPRRDRDRRTGRADKRYLDGVWSGQDVRRLDGVLSWGELAGADRRRAVYVGPDTSVTHLAAATGVPDGRALRADRSAAVRAVAGGRARRSVGRGRHDPAARQRLAGAKSAAVPAVPAGGLRAPPRELQPVPRRTDAAPGAGGRGSGRCAGRRSAMVARLRKRRYGKGHASASRLRHARC